MNHRATSLLFGGLVLVTACGGGSSRAGFDDVQQDNNQTSDPNNGGGGGDGTFGQGNSAGLTLEPKNTTVIIDSATNPATPGSVTFKVLQKASGADKDITA